MNKKKIVALIVPILFCINLSVPAYAKDELRFKDGPTFKDVQTMKKDDSLFETPSNFEGRDQPMDYRNHIQDIQQFIDQNISKDVFASLHLDRNSLDQDMVMLSFTSGLSAEQRNKILALAEDPDLVVFRVVDFSENQLSQKQKEIDQAWDNLAQQGIQVFTTSVNVFTNRVEIGIEPYNDFSVQKIHQLFGSSMVHVVQGYPVTLLSTADTDISLSGSTENGTNTLSGQQNIIERVVLFIKSFISWLRK